MTTYKHRYRETYKGIKIDLRANTSAELNAKVTRKKQQIDRGTIDEKSKLEEFGRMYLETYKLHKVSASWYSDLEIILWLIVRRIGNKPIGSIRPIEIQNYLNSLTGFSDSYIKKQFDFIVQLFRHAYRNGATASDLTVTLTRPDGKPATNGRSLTDPERRFLLEVLTGHRGELFCKLILYCGLRPSEVQALQWQDIDLNRNIVTVSKSMKKDGSIGKPKTANAYRSVPVPDHFAQLLAAHEAPPEQFLFPLNLEWRKKMWRNIRRDMNIIMGCKVYRNQLIPPLPLASDFTMYNLRHTYCTDLEKAGVPINIASRLMGHSSISITSKIYTHESEIAFERARNLINNYQK